VAIGAVADDLGHVLVDAAADGSGTREWVSREVIDALGPDSYPANIARGSAVDEPTVPEALLGMDNVVVLPHVGSGTVRVRAAIEALTLRNLDSFLATGDLVTPVPLPAGASG
jgi:lactate dehydrogenase-like 2-hydroxyacid dehydrogenase